jgi:hypothetical protein
MCVRRHSWLILIVSFVVLASGSSASAQSWLSDRKRAEGRGIRLGDFELHPGIGAEVGYYTNPFFSDRPKGSGAFRVSPHIFLSTLRAERAGEDTGETPGWLALNAGLSAAFQHFFLYGARDAINTDLSLDATFAPGRSVSFRVTELLRRSALPFGDTALPPDLLDTQRAPDYTNYYEDAGAQLLFQTAGGLLKGSLGYRFGYYWFDDAGFKYNNNITHTGAFNLGWEFLPKTAFFYDLTFTHQTYPKVDDPTLQMQALTVLSNNDQLNTRIGINGAITSRLGATVAVGYSAGFYRIGDEPHGLIGLVEARYTPSPTSQLGLTFDRSFLPSYQGNFQERNRVYARARWLFAGALLVAARAGVEFLTFGHDERQDPNSNVRRDDRRYFADLNGEYRFVDWLAVTAQFTFLVDDTAYQYKLRTLGITDPAKFTAIEAWLGVRAFL